MNSSSKTGIAICILVIVAVGFGVYALRQSQNAKDRIAALETKLASATARNAEQIEDKVAVPISNTIQPSGKLAPTSGSAGDDIHARVATLKDVFRRLPEQSIPELKLATDSDWYSAADGKLESEEDYRRALAKLRGLAEARFAKALQPALRDYIAANNGRFPTSTSELHAYASREIDASMLIRYHIVPASNISNVRMGGDVIITQTSVVDTEYDSVTVIGPRGHGSTNATMPGLMKETDVVLPAIRAYKAATGKGHTDILQVLPYASTPEQQAVIRKWAQKEIQRKGP